MSKVNLRKTENGYLFDFYHRDIHGNLRRSRHLIRNCSDHRMAESIARRLKNDADRLGYVPGYDPEPISFTGGHDQSYPFDALASHWFNDHVRQRARKHSDVCGAESSLRARLIPYFGSTQVDQIDTQMVDGFVNQCLNGPGPKLAPKSVNNHLVFLRRLFDYAYSRGYVDSVPVIESLPIQKSRKIRGFNASDRDRFLEACWKWRREWFPYFYLATHTAMRHGEICALRWSDIDFKNRQLHVNRALYRGQEGSPKTEREGPIPMTTDLCEILKTLPRKGDRVFYSTKGNELGPNSGTKVLKTLCKLAGLKEIRKHDLRHTVGYCLGQSPTGFMAANHIMGHEDPNTTLNYCHIADDEVAAEIARITTPLSELGVDLGELKKEMKK